MIMIQKFDYGSQWAKRKVFFLIFWISVGAFLYGHATCPCKPDQNKGFGIMANAIQSTVTGTVTDDTGAPLPGANVLVKGTTTGTQTDFDGNYTITADSGATLEFSYIGFATQEIAVDGQTTINVSMAEDAAALDEVIVTGYSTQTRGDLTGAVSSVDLSEAIKAPITNAAEALQGRTSGVTVLNSGSPGGTPIIRIRGFGTSNSNAPLFIIDGVQTDDASILNNINPSDIKQMNVLKDGSASIYGARASNGVVIITTKNGGYNLETASIKLDMYTGFSKACESSGRAKCTGAWPDMIFTKLGECWRTRNPPTVWEWSLLPVVPATLQVDSNHSNEKTRWFNLVR